MVFIPNPNFLKELGEQDEYRAALQEQAEGAKSEIEAIAPRGETGDYSRSIIVVDDGHSVTVGSADPFAHLVEWGSANNPPYAPLRRGTRAAGLRLEEEKK